MAKSLSLAKELYTELLIEKGTVSNPAVIQFRQFMCNNFPHEGQKAAAAIEANRQAGYLTNPESKPASNAPKMKRWQHPGVTTGEAEAPRILQSFRKVTGQSTPLSSQILEDAVPVVDGEGIEVAGPVLDLEWIKTSTGSEVAKTYPTNVLRAYMDIHGISYNPTGNDKQVANALVHHLKQK